MQETYVATGLIFLQILSCFEERVLSTLNNFEIPCFSCFVIFGNYCTYFFLFRHLLFLIFRLIYRCMLVSLPSRTSSNSVPEYSIILWFLHLFDFLALFFQIMLFLFLSREKLVLTTSPIYWSIHVFFDTYISSFLIKK